MKKVSHCQHCGDDTSGYIIDFKMKCGNCDEVIKEMTKEEVEELYRELMKQVGGK